jgi:tetrahydrodipicolinate N-acetyltransferase
MSFGSCPAHRTGKPAASPFGKGPTVRSRSASPPGVRAGTGENSPAGTIQPCLCAWADPISSTRADIRPYSSLIARIGRLAERQAFNMGIIQRLRRLDRYVPLSSVLRVSVFRTIYHSRRAGGQCIVIRGTRLRLEPGSKIQIAPGGRLVLGARRDGPAPCSVHLMRNARLSVHGPATIMRGARILVAQSAHLEIGPRSYINYDSTVTCYDHITIGAECAISWNVNILDGNGHDLVVAGEQRPSCRPIVIGDNVWIGTGAVILSGVTIGDGAVVAAGSVITSDVPSKTVAAGNPARVVREGVTWAM